MRQSAAPLRSVSPDGRWLVVYEVRELGARPHGVGKITTGETTLWAVHTESGEARKLWYQRWGYAENAIGLQLVWSGDGSTLHGIAGDQLLSWHPGEAVLTPVNVTISRNGMRLWSLLARPGTDQVMLWLHQLEPSDHPGRQKIVGGKVLLVDAEGKVSESPVSDSAKGHLPVGFNSEGKLILEHTTPEAAEWIATADLDTGEVRRLYP